MLENIGGLQYSGYIIMCKLLKSSQKQSQLKVAGDHTVGVDA